ncbi:hypothetical protein EST38_g12076 [Candolleomyces aberdarensis]|uniref:HMG domain-containing protein n=1 Tax=Candolleomyces aberdarensis TaxID=2316362 RepID=A0A4Q2D407_9AGAR|nr:hypothetical protein EST38_g12076 [Candolleomyces aberdarensis]
MAPKRRMLCDTPEEFEYPSALVPSVKDAAWDSPTKATKQYQQGFERRRKSAKRATKDTVDSDYDDESMVDLEFGSFPSPVFAESAPTSLPMAGAKVEQYLEAVEACTAGLFHIGGLTFVVEGWDVGRSQATGAWYHLQYLPICNDELRVACTCPQGLQENCVHQEFFKVYAVEHLLPDQDQNAAECPSVVIFQRKQVLSMSDFTTTFSVKSFSSSVLKGRAIVTHTGSRASTGTWRCSKDSGTNGTCTHIASARKALEDLIGADDGELDANISLEGMPSKSLASVVRSTSVSHLPILPPVSVVLKSDPDVYTRPPPFRSSPTHPLAIDAMSSCPCPTGRTLFDPNTRTTHRSCRIYTLYTVFEAEIEIQACPSCPPARRRFIGPDLREYGLFNYNNSILASHELLDEYTMSFVSSETPFTAFVSVLSHRYTVSGATFMGEDLFRSIWFSYASLQAFDNDYKCTRCGPYPETVIWDGITLAFGRKHLSSTLSPPTQISPHSLLRPHIKNHPKQQLISDVRLRRHLREVLNVPNLDLLLSSDDADADDEKTGEKIDEAEHERRARRLRDHLDKIQSVHSGLAAECVALASLFLDAYGAVAFSSRRPIPASHRSFFLQRNQFFK